MDDDVEIVFVFVSWRRIADFIIVAPETKFRKIYILQVVQVRDNRCIINEAKYTFLIKNAMNGATIMKKHNRKRVFAFIAAVLCVLMLIGCASQGAGNQGGQAGQGGNAGGRGGSDIGTLGSVRTGAGASVSGAMSSGTSGSTSAGTGAGGTGTGSSGGVSSGGIGIVSKADPNKPHLRRRSRSVIHNRIFLARKSAAALGYIGFIGIGW